MSLTIRAKIRTQMLSNDHSTRTMDMNSQGIFTSNEAQVEINYTSMFLRYKFIRKRTDVSHKCTSSPWQSTLVWNVSPFSNKFILQKHICLICFYLCFIILYYAIYHGRFTIHLYKKTSTNICTSVHALLYIFCVIWTWFIVGS